MIIDQQTSKTPSRLIDGLSYLPGIILGVLSATLRFKALQQSTFANGQDGYAYLVQLKSWAEDIAPQSAGQSLFDLLLRIAYWFSTDYILSLNLLTASLAGLATFGMYLVAKRWSGSLYIALLLGSISLFSPHLTYFAAQYPQHLLGLVLLLFFIGSLVGKSKYLAFVWLLLGFFAHPLTFALAVVFGLAWGLFNDFSIKKIAIVLVSGLLLFAMQVVVHGLPGWTGFSELGALFSARFQFAPYSFIQTFGAQDPIADLWSAEIILASAIYFLSIPFLWRARHRWMAFTLFGISTVLLFPFFAWDLDGLAGLFFLLYVLLAPLFIPLLLKMDNDRVSKAGLLLIAVVLMLGSIYSWRTYQPEKQDADYQKYAQLTVQASEYLDLENAELVIAHRTLAAYFSFTTGIAALPWIPEHEVAPDRLWRMVTDIRQSEMGCYLSENEMAQVHKLSIRYFLLPDYLWQKILRQAREKGDDFLIKKLETWRNPYKVRPG